MENRPSVFNDALYAAIEESAQAMWERQRQMDRDAIPDRETMRQLFEAAFFASLRNEEGKPITTRLTYIDPDRLANCERLGGKIAALTFSEDYPCEESELVKLSPSIDPRTATFVAVSTPNGLRIAGVVQFGPNASPLYDGPRYVAPMGFGILTTGPGRLAITFSHLIVGHFEDGRFRRPEPECLHEAGSLGQIFFQTALAHSWHEADPRKYALLYLRCVEELFHIMEARGHGGGVLWVPRSLVPEAEKHLTIRRRFQKVMKSGVDHLQSLATTEGDGREQMRSGLRQYVAMLAQFACVDGALVVDDFLKPIGYSAKISAPTWSGEIENMSSFDRFPVELKKFGMRHNSAAEFVSVVPGAIALVFSQDGPARALFSTAGRLQFWPNCRSSMFV